MPKKPRAPLEFLGNDIDLGYVPDAQLALVGGKPSPTGNGHIVVACAGTSDLPVAEEAALTAEFYGNESIASTTWVSPACTACSLMLRNLPRRRWSSPSPAWKAPWRALSAVL